MTSVTPALSIATSVPVPIAIPTSACASAGASLMPSPAIATTLPAACSSATIRFLSSGETSACTSSMPIRRATACAVIELSPVSMTILSPALCSASIACGVDSFIGSATPSSPAELPSTATNITVCPSLRDRSASSASVWSKAPIACISLLLPTATCLPDTVARAPWPVTDSKSSYAGKSSERSFAPATIALARGCSLATSTAAARDNNSSCSNPSTGFTMTNAGRPSVSVPVLSTTTVSTFSKVSSASAFFIRTPFCAPFPVPTMIDIGVASPSAQGQAIISTATALTIA